MSEREHLESFLLEEFKSGNSRAFDKIFNNHYQNLCRFAYSIVHDVDTAHSLVQQVFVNLWENRASLGHIDHLIPYLTAMVRNNCLNFISRDRRNIKMADLPTDSRTENTTENQINLHDFEEHLIIALSLLPERCKIAFEYSRFDNFSNKEIAIKMEISTKGVEALIGRALKSLRLSLADYLPSSGKSKLQSPLLFMLIRIDLGKTKGMKNESGGEETVCGA